MPQLDLILTLAPLVIILIFLLGSSIKVIREYERVVVFRLGKLERVAGPGVVWLIPFVDKALLINLREKLPGWQGMSERERERRTRELALGPR